MKQVSFREDMQYPNMGATIVACKHFKPCCSTRPFEFEYKTKITEQEKDGAQQLNYTAEPLQVGLMPPELFRIPAACVSDTCSSECEEGLLASSGSLAI